MSETTDYTLELANTPDGDGDYAAIVRFGDGEQKHFYRKSREDARIEAVAWVERHRAYDPDDYETIALP